MTKFSLSALVAAGVLAGGLATSASAADLGGNCCADLEERIAELEATTARKGNRKVSLTVSGFVAKQLLFFDDGRESNVRITDTGSISIGTHVKFTGQATIAPGVTAGYVLKIEAVTDDSLLVNQNSNNSVGSAFGTGGIAGGLGVESSYWFVKSDTLGRVSLGRQSSAVDNQAILPDGSGTLVVANYVQYDNNAFGLRNKNGALSSINYGSLATCATLNGAGGASADCDGVPNSNIRYDTPTFAGFSASASWGEDDIWGVSGRYAGEFSGVKLSVAVAYVESTDENFFNGGFNGQAAANGGFSAQAFQVGGYLEHVPTGLFVYGAYAKDYSDVSEAVRGAGLTNPEGDNWYIKPGIRTHLNSLGQTIFYGEYGKNNDKLTSALYDAGISSSDLKQYGLGVVQEVDSAAMSFWLAWRHYDASVTCDVGFSCARAGNALTTTAGKNNFDNLDIIKAGALINF